MSLLIIRTAQILHKLTAAVCLALVLGLVVSEVLVVLLRYVYNIGFLQLQNFTGYCFAALVVLAIPYALALDFHVRVDVFREHQSVATRLRFDIAAILLLLFPVFGLTLYYVWPDILYSWSITEGSRETGGLPGLYLVKTCLPIACVLMMVQGMAIIARRGAKMELDQ